MNEPHPIDHLEGHLGENLEPISGERLQPEGDVVDLAELVELDLVDLVEIIIQTRDVDLMLRTIDAVRQASGYDK